MPEFKVVISEEGLKGIEAADGGRCCSFQTWIQNAASDKGRKSIDLLGERFSDFNFKHLSQVRKEAEVKKMQLETAKERIERIKKEETEEEVKEEAEA